MILVFGGTTEGKKVAGILEKAACSYYYSTKTNIDFRPGVYGQYRHGALTAAQLQAFCEAHTVRAIVHASHPFATLLHATIYECAAALSLPVLRFERNYPERTQHPLVKYCASYVEAMAWLEQRPVNRLLALTGVQTIAPLANYWKQHDTIFRILPRESSLALAEQAGFPRENLIQEMPGDDLQQELAIIRQYGIGCVLTKESGESGFLATKIQAALQSNIPILIIERPALPDTFIPVSDETSLMAGLNRVLS
ncbi:precorrin-6A/cobalt-precorrin-6A reductase [Chitinophaga filiformis]|uniref:precorrin-6A/cobalt-precorrin-6A reductase n=1 Tax=Chitinophaga filiformis TaxID=104663 RepID=UPI001F3FAB01|nr:precorrin-6A/cobalt-precorrin-6A reductase [Chitinophaga filiformis]MCF6405166.1 precorrin-6A/cobalt-precorrin-6A reductase [Chitinophaga filiformis]